ncbi:MAG TPA: sugar transferase [Acidimicrobiia bacterium]|nr:sugar transferase [Acidimicrobiia bacterium]
MTERAPSIRPEGIRRRQLTLVPRGTPVGPSWLAKYPRRSTTSIRRYERIARWRDLALVTLTAPLWLSLITVIALLVRFQDPSAPVFFRQPRTGRDGRRFEVLKFRTMVRDAEEMKQDLMHLNELTWPDFKISNDPRVTKIGRILRSSSLDELPQLFNVVAGDMALVGPRPTSFGVETYEIWHTARLDLRPGMTGLWQVAARADLEWDRRVRLELAYVERMSTALDFEILIRTLGAVFNRSGQ